MARLAPPRREVPATLATYRWRRWERESIADRAGLNLCTPTPYSFTAIIYAPALYRAALTAAVGKVAGDRYFWAQMSTPRVQNHKADAARAGVESTKEI